MHEETMINQPAQESAVACARVARLLGQLAPSCMRLPVLKKKNLDEQRSVWPWTISSVRQLRLGRRQITIGLFLVIFDGHDEPFGFVGADLQPCTPDHRHYLSAASDADGGGRPGMGWHSSQRRAGPVADPNVLSAAALRDHFVRH